MSYFESDTRAAFLKRHRERDYGTPDAESSSWDRRLIVDGICTIVTSSSMRSFVEEDEATILPVGAHHTDTRS
jgi:hypothetical protein